MWFDIIKTRFVRLWKNKHTNTIAKIIKTTTIPSEEEDEDGVVSHILRDIRPRGRLPATPNPKEPVYGEHSVTDEQLKEHWEEITS